MRNRDLLRMSNKFEIEIICNLLETTKLREQWNKLYQAMDEIHPFSSYEWFENWYFAYCNSGDERIILVKEADNIKAIFPGLIDQIYKGGIRLHVFRYAANGHSPRCGIIAKKMNYEAIAAALKAPFYHSKEKFDLIIVPSVNANSDTDQVLKKMNDHKIQLHSEHKFESPAYKISNGWQSYLMTKSKSFRRTEKRSVNCFERYGPINYDIYSTTSINKDVIKRLRVIDSKSWQHKNKSGLFSTQKNRIFYELLFRNESENDSISICFLRVNEKDAAYIIGITSNFTAYLLKYGYNPKFSKCSPGHLIQRYFSKYYSSLGFNEIDLIGENTEEKSRWANFKRKHNNYWLINKNRIKGILLLLGFRLHHVQKKLYIKNFLFEK